MKNNLEIGTESTYDTKIIFELVGEGEVPNNFHQAVENKVTIHPLQSIEKHISDKDFAD